MSNTDRKLQEAHLLKNKTHNRSPPSSTVLYGLFQQWVKVRVEVVWKIETMKPCDFELVPSFIPCNLLRLADERERTLIVIGSMKSGILNTSNSASDVKATLGVSSLPTSVYVANVSTDTRIGTAEIKKVLRALT